MWMLTSCSEDDTVKKEVVRPVKSMVIGNVIDPTGKGYPGVTKESIESKISFRVGGPIVKYNVVEGAKVKKGDIVAEIDSRDFRIDVQSTQARYNQAKAEADRYHRLWKKGSVAKNDYDRRHANSLEAKAALDNAKNALEDTKLRAPFSGFYGSKLVEIGDKVKVKQAITTIVDLSVIEISTTIPEQLAIQIANFDKFEVLLEAYPEITFSAKLKQLQKKPTPEGFPLLLFLDHTNNPDDPSKAKIGAGMSCRVNISLKSNSDKPEAIIIPLVSIFENPADKKTVVWVIDPESNTVKMQTVVLGSLTGNSSVKITEGLSMGQQIVIAGVHRLTAGNKVNILK